jgi:hypothetical protein
VAASLRVLVLAWYIQDFPEVSARMDAVLNWRMARWNSLGIIPENCGASIVTESALIVGCLALSVIVNVKDGL